MLASYGGPIATEPEFAALLGRPVPAPRPLWPLHLDSTISDLRQSRLGAKTSDALLKVATKQFDLGPDAATQATLKAAVVQSPLRSLVAMSGGKVSFETLERALAVLSRLKR